MSAEATLHSTPPATRNYPFSVAKANGRCQMLSLTFSPAVVRLLMQLPDMQQKLRHPTAAADTSYVGGLAVRHYAKEHHVDMWTL